MSTCFLPVEGLWFAQEIPDTEPDVSGSAYRTLFMDDADPSGRAVCGASLLGLRFRIPPGARMSVYCGVLCVVRQRSLRRGDNSSRGVPPSVVCLN
jgi:hypothetical protein